VVASCTVERDVFTLRPVLKAAVEQRDAAGRLFLTAQLIARKRTVLEPPAGRSCGRDWFGVAGAILTILSCVVEAAACSAAAAAFRSFWSLSRIVRSPTPCLAAIMGRGSRRAFASARMAGQTRCDRRL